MGRETLHHILLFVDDYIFKFCKVTVGRLGNQDNFQKFYCSYMCSSKAMLFWNGKILLTSITVEWLTFQTSICIHCTNLHLRELKKLLFQSWNFKQTSAISLRLNHKYFRYKSSTGIFWKNHTKKQLTAKFYLFVYINYKLV